MKYQDLNDEQKQAARDWWINCEMQDPAWYSEHVDSLKAALNAVKNGLTMETIQQFRDCKPTGYCADAILSDMYDNFEDLDCLTAAQVEHAYAAAWDDEMSDRMTDEYIEECIEANEYDFEPKSDSLIYI